MGVTQLLLAVHAPAVCVGRLVGANLVAITKPQRDHGLIAQGVGASGGAEHMVHTTMQWFQRASAHNDHVLVLMDVKNAFNSVDRAAIMQAVPVRHHCPKLVPFVDFVTPTHRRSSS
eukprot:1825007-Amphidinium_carterae.4